MENGLTNEYRKVVLELKQCNTETALSIMKNIGDINFINKIENYMFSKLEIERLTLIDQLVEAILDERLRFSDGKIEEKKDKKISSFLELIDLLKNDEKCYFYPLLQDYKYNKFERDIVKSGYPSPIYNYSSKIKFSNIQWHENYLNLSILGKIEVSVDVPEKIVYGATTYFKPKSLPDLIKSFKWGKYLLIVDGKLNVKDIVVSCSSDVAEILKNNKLLSDTQPINDGAFYSINVTNLPVISDNELDDKIFMRTLFKDYIEEIYLKAKEKVLKNLKLDIETKNRAINEKKIIYSASEMSYLSLFGFKSDGSFYPPVEEDNKNNKFNAVLFDLKINGLSSLPPLDDLFKTKKPDGSVLGLSLLELHVNTIINETKNLGDNHAKKYELICKRLKETENKLKQIKEKIQKQKFNVIIKNKWFEDIPNIPSKEHSFIIEKEKIFNFDIGGRIKIYTEEVTV